eukprot:Pgem_evm1s18598
MEKPNFCALHKNFDRSFLSYIVKNIYKKLQHNTEKALKLTHNFECDSIRNIWVECVTILKLRNINLSA